VTSFSIDASNLLSTAAEIFNGLFPAFAVVAGIGLGIGLIRYIVKAIQDAF
jgi:hypothetical protein